LLNKASYARQLADNLLQDLVEPFKAALLDQKRDLDQALYEPQNLEKERTAKVKLQVNCKSRYFKSCSELTELAM
jgi:hypothetical protein